MSSTIYNSMTQLIAASPSSLASQRIFHTLTSPTSSSHVSTSNNTHSTQSISATTTRPPMITTTPTLDLVKTVAVTQQATQAAVTVSVSSGGPAATAAASTASSTTTPASSVHSLSPRSDNVDDSVDRNDVEENSSSPQIDSSRIAMPPSAAHLAQPPSYGGPTPSPPSAATSPQQQPTAFLHRPPISPAHPHLSHPHAHYAGLPMHPYAVGSTVTATISAIPPATSAAATTTISPPPKNSFCIDALLSRGTPDTNGSQPPSSGSPAIVSASEVVAHHQQLTAAGHPLAYAPMHLQHPHLQQHSDYMHSRLMAGHNGNDEDMPSHFQRYERDDRDEFSTPSPDGSR